jgi:hypothetical protein
MSLSVSAGLLEQASHGEVDDAEFLDCVRTSLPYAWDVVTGLVKELESGSGEFAGNEVPPPDEQARGQLLRMMASDAMRAAGLSSSTRVPSSSTAKTAGEERVLATSVTPAPVRGRGARRLLSLGA